MWVGQPPLDDARNAERHARDIVAGKSVLLAQRQHSVDTGGDTRRRRMRLHQHVHEVEALTKSVLDGGGIPSVGIGTGKTAGAFDDIDGTAIALLSEQRGRNAALGRMRGLDALRRRAG